MVCDTHQKTLIYPSYTKKPHVNYYLCSFVKLIQSVEYRMNICVVIKEGYTDLHSYSHLNTYVKV